MCVIHWFTVRTLWTWPPPDGPGLPYLCVKDSHLAETVVSRIKSGAIWEMTASFSH